MHAWICEAFDGPDALQWKEQATPEPGKGEVRVAIDDRNDINRIESDQAPLRRSAVDPIDRTMGQRRSLFEPVGRSASRTPGLVRVSGWRATGRQNSEAPILLPVQMSVAVAD